MAFKIFLPSVVKPNQKYPGALVGVHCDFLPVKDMIAYIPHQSIVQIAVFWSECEVMQGVYTWPAQFEQSLQALHSKGCKFIVQTKGCPEWARIYPGYITSPPKPEFYPAYANFLKALIAHCGAGIFAVALFNEPDTVRQELAPDWIYFSTWIEIDNLTQGGKDYAAMTKVVYPIVKASYPNISVHVGELMFTNHTHFLSDAFGGGLMGDALSIHVYPRYEWMSRFSLTESQVFEYFAEQVKTAKALTTGFDVFVSETSLLYNNENKTPAEVMQAKYFDFLRALFVFDNPMVGFIWYFLGVVDKWENSQMIDGSQRKLVYTHFIETMAEYGNVL